MEPLDRITIVVPVRNEEQLLGASLGHIRTAMDQWADGGRGSVRLVVVLDGCTDGSADIVADVAASDTRIRTVHTQVRAVGAARDLGVRTALAGVQGPSLHRHWIANTDADTTVPPNWLHVFAAAADAGADALVGTVEPDASELGQLRYLAWRALYVREEGHPHIHGANLGVRASAYCDAGGFPPVTGDEDVQLVQALRDRGADVRSSTELHVVTSARLRGRASHGFAEYLARLPGAGRDAGVAEPKAAHSFDPAGRTS